MLSPWLGPICDSFFLAPLCRRVKTSDVVYEMRQAAWSYILKEVPLPHTKGGFSRLLHNQDT